MRHALARRRFVPCAVNIAWRVVSEYSAGESEPRELVEHCYDGYSLLGVFIDVSAASNRSQCLGCTFCFRVRTST